MPGSTKIVKIDDFVASINNKIVVGGKISKDVIKQLELKNNKVIDILEEGITKVELLYNGILMEILEKFIHIFEQNYEIFLEKGFSYFRDKYITYSNLINKKVIHSVNNIKQEATIVDITSTGKLVLQSSEKKFEVFSGEILFIGNNSGRL